MSGIVDALSSGASMLARPVLAAAGTSGTTPTTQPGGQGQEFGSASTLGFVVLVLFFIGVAFLARSMAKHLKRAQQNLGTEDAAAEAPYDVEAYDVVADAPADTDLDASPEAARPPSRASSSGTSGSAASAASASSSSAEASPATEPSATTAPDKADA